MVDAGVEWLPRFGQGDSQESTEEYQNRICQVRMFPGYRRALNDHMRRVHSEPVSVHKDIIGSRQLMAWLGNLDGNGTPIDVFSGRFFRMAEQDGGAHVYLDKRGDDVVASLVSADQHFNWADGERQIAVDREDADVLILTPGNVQKATINEANKELSKGDTLATGVGVITLVSLVFRPIRSGSIAPLPELEDLAWANLEDWQISASKSVSLRHLAPIYSATGIQDSKESLPRMVDGAIQFISTSADASFTREDPAGQGVRVLQEEIEKLRDEQHWLAYEPMVRSRRGSDQLTATEVGMRAQAAQSPLQSMSIQHSRALTEVLRMAARLMGLGGDSVPDMALQTVQDFDRLVSQGDVELIVGLLERLRRLTRPQAEAALRVMMERDLLPDDTDTAELAGTGGEPDAEAGG